MHSAYAAVLPSAAWRLVEVLRAIKDPATDRILIPGFYDDVIPPTQDDLQNLAEDNFDEEGLRQFWGVDHYINHLHGVDLLKKLYYEPTANICGMESGYNGEGGKTVMPAEASAKIDFRLVPGQQPEKILNLLKSYLHQKGFDDVEVIADSGQAPYRSVPDSAFVKAVYRTLDGLFGKPVVHYMLTGTSPMPVFCAKKHIPAAMFGGTSTKANIHAPNEHIAISSYMDEIKMIAGVMEELGRQG